MNEVNEVNERRPIRGERRVRNDARAGEVSKLKRPSRAVFICEKVQCFAIVPSDVSESKNSSFFGSGGGGASRGRGGSGPAAFLRSTGGSSSPVDRRARGAGTGDVRGLFRGAADVSCNASCGKAGSDRAYAKRYRRRLCRIEGGVPTSRRHLSSRAARRAAPASSPPPNKAHREGVA